MTATPSHFQTAIFEWIQAGRGHAFVEAVAGSGKTWTLVEAAKLLRSDALFCAFNKHIQTELAIRLAGTSMTVATIHSHGYRAVRGHYSRTRVEGGKYREMAYDLVDHVVATGRLAGRRLTDETIEAVREERPAHLLVRLVDLVRMDLAEPTPEVLARLVAHHGLDVQPELWPVVELAVPALIARGRERVADVVDFGDMVWLPCIDEAVRVERYPWVFVDEAQDLCAAQLEVMLRSLAPGGRLLAVGDRRQAIYGFAGADTSSIDRILERTGATVLPLSICYRCPTSHLDLAREIVPQIEAAPWAVSGVVGSVAADKLAAAVQEGDLVLCRTTAPLVKTCYALIGAGVSAKVRGKDIGAQLGALLERIAGGKRRRVVWLEVPTAIESWRREQLAKIVAKTRDPEDPACERVNDQADCLLAFVEATEATSVRELRTEIEELFSDGRSSVMLSTVHRAKGLEERRVFLLRPELLPFPYARQDWQREQEQNLKYVALTRAKAELWFVETKPAPVVAEGERR